MILKVIAENWGLSGPGDWERSTWKINRDGTYTMKKRYRPLDGDSEDSEKVTEGALDAEQMEILKECIDEFWSNEKADACDGTGWEFKLYESGTVIRHREMGYIDGVEPFESIAALLDGNDEEEEDA